MISPEVTAAIIGGVFAICSTVLAYRLGRSRPRRNLGDMPEIESEQLGTRQMFKLLEKGNFRCALTGLPLNHDNASIDREYGPRGVHDNGMTRLVRRDIKRLKGDFPDDKFRELCRAVAEYKGKT